MASISSKNIADKRWRINHLYKIVNKAGAKVRFVENDIQQQINDCTNKRKIVLKARQFGVSTNGIIDLLDETLFHKNKNHCILAHDQDAIEKLFRIARRAYDFMDEDLKPVLDRGGGSKYEMFFPELNSRIYACIKSRGDTIHRLHCSEVAFIQDQSRLLATLETVPLDGHITFESTPNGMNFFYDYWMDHGFKYAKLFFPWFFFKEYQIYYHGNMIYSEEEREFILRTEHKFDIVITKHQMNFRRQKQSELKHLFVQEYPEDDASCFLASGHAAMDLVKVKMIMDKAPRPIQDGGSLKVFEKYNRNYNYVAGADTAEGVGSDYSVLTIYNAVTRKPALIYRAHLKPIDFAERADKYCRQYWTGGRPYPLLAVERNNHGHAVLLALEDIYHYPNLFKTGDDKVGWITDRVTRPIMIDAFIDGVENETFNVFDHWTLSECLTLIDNNGKIEAEKDKHDDCIIASAIALQMCIKYGNLSVYENLESKIRC